jgi:uncharacterized protein YbaP (TraB family)
VNAKKLGAKSNCMPSIALLLLAGFAMADAGTKPAPETKEPALDVVLVTGEHPGPSLWKVTSGDHTLWILGEVMPLPRRMKWRSTQFERLLKESQEVLVDDSDRVPEPANPQEFVALHNAGKLPRGQTLQELISPDMYARVMAVRETFGVPVELKPLRPWAAGSVLYFAAYDSKDLVEFSVADRAAKLAHKAKIPVTNIHFQQTFAELIGSLESAWGDDCLTRNVEILEDGGFGMRRLANAWSIGDIDQLRNLVPAYALANESWGPNEVTVCYRGGRERAREYFEQRTAAWLKDCERVLRDHRSTIAVMPIGWLLAPDGFVAQLRARGYEVEEPE